MGIAPGMEGGRKKGREGGRGGATAYALSVCEEGGHLGDSCLGFGSLFLRKEGREREREGRSEGGKTKDEGENADAAGGEVWRKERKREEEE